MLVLAGTPIGRVADAPPRLAEELATADVVAAEDTRRLRRLTTELGVTPAGRVVSYFEGNESARTPALVEALLAGDRVLLVTDAGMPSVSDPGYRLVAAAVEQGFAPRKAGERRRVLADLRDERRTMVFFESPHRTEATLAAMAEAFGADRPAAVCRELTKTHEEVRRAGLADLATWAADGVRGEVTIVVQGASPTVADAATDARSLAALVADVEGTGTTRKDAIREVAQRTGVPKRTVYDAVHKPQDPSA